MVEEDEENLLSEEAEDKYECQANYANLDESKEMVLMAYTDTLRGDRDDVWFIDYGCSNHMCGDSSLFCDLEEGFNKVDVIFEVEEQWNWERSFKDDRRFDLEWEDDNSEEVEDFDDGSEEENVASLVRDESSDGNEKDEADPPMTPRVRRAPAYLNDFVSGDGLSDEGEELIGSMMYLTATRPNIMYAVSLLSKYISRPTELHHLAAKRILRYLQGTTTFDILYRRGGSHELIGFTDSDYVG
ncbi:hypothetical protein KIW84_072189 [Lathyrus oleraceus]|uniref:Uncharacterized protein n=1 Tax=Pisum sativum TaxID=3888 RepID=A0A9D4ZU16_PEA|nr:hypothetical protein KIW84_072189 [Pisum sativum]